MDRAGSYYHKEAIASAHDHARGLFATLDHRLDGGLGLGDLGDEECRRDQGILSEDFG